MEVASVAVRRKAMEEIRYADRLIGGALGTFQGQRRGNFLEVVGSNLGRTDGFFGEHDVRDNTAALQDVAEAEGAFRRALKLLGRKDADADPFVELGVGDGIVERVLDILQLMRAQENAERAQELHRTFVRVFEALRSSDPELHGEPSLPDWDEDLVDVAKTQLQFNPGMRLRAGLAVVGAIVVAVTVVFNVVAWIRGEGPDSSPYFDDDDRDAGPTVAEPVAGKLIDAGRIPAQLTCPAYDEARSCVSTCERRRVCFTYAADLDGDGHEDWVLVGADPFAEAGAPARVEAYRFEEGSPVRIGPSFEVEGEILEGLTLLPRRSASGLQPICVHLGAPGEMATQACYELDDSWTKVEFDG